MVWWKMPGSWGRETEWMLQGIETAGRSSCRSFASKRAVVSMMMTMMMREVLYLSETSVPLFPNTLCYIMEIHNSLIRNSLPYVVRWPQGKGGLTKSLVLPNRTSRFFALCSIRSCTTSRLDSHWSSKQVFTKSHIALSSMKQGRVLI